MSMLQGIFDFTRIRYIIFLNMPFILSAFVLTRNFNPTLIILVCVSYFFAHFFVNAINDLCDIESDKVHPVKSVENPILSGKLSFKEAQYITLALPIISLLIAVPTNIIWFCAVIFFLFLGWSYSANPLRTRARPLGFLLNESLGCSIAFIWTYWAVKPPPHTEWSLWIIPIAIYIFFSNAIIVCKDLPDMGPDRKAGFKTFSVAFGVKITQRFVLFSAIASFAVYVYLLASHVFSIVSLPFAVIGVLMPLKNLLKPTDLITERHLIYQKVIPASIFYLIALIIGVFARLFLPW